MKRVSVAVLAALFAAGCSSPMGSDAAQTRAIGGQNVLDNLDDGGTPAITKILIPFDLYLTLNPGDEIIITGQPPGMAELINCAAGTYPVQQGIIRYSGTGTQPTRLSELIVISQTTAIAPGSQFVILTYGGQCNDDGITYNIYFGTVQ